MTTTMDWATIESPCVTEITTTCYCDVDCYGDCYTFAVEDMEENIFPEAMARLGNPTYVRIDGRNMGWQNLSGHAIAQGTWESVYNKLSINGDFTMRFTLAGDTLSVVRSSHDEPTGAYFTIVADLGIMED